MGVIQKMPRVRGWRGSLESITPSRWTSLAQCTAKGLADALDLEGELPKSPPSRGTLVGRFHHRLMELAASSSSAVELDAKIEAEIRLLQHEVSKHSHIRQAGSVSGWRDVNVSASLAIRMFEMRDQRRADGETVHVETELKARDGFLIGRPDAFRVHGGGAFLREFKTGAIRDETGGIRKDYLDQITLYAALIFANYSVEAVEASIESLAGDRHEATIHREQARQLAEHVTDALVKVNELVRSARSLSDLARPSADACSYCPVRCICVPFKASQDSLALKGDQLLAEGTVDSIQGSQEATPRTVSLRDEFRSVEIKLVIPTTVAAQLFEKRRYQFINLQRRGPELEWSATAQALVYG
jgi:CRISPR/Cas system-associated exonuclease Cas4 (RecB family)